MTQALQPVARQALLTPREHIGTQVGLMLIRQDQAPAVVGNQLALSALQVSLPAVARRTLQRGGRKLSSATQAASYCAT